MSGYCRLEAGKGYLKNLDPLATDPQHGITQEDLAACEEAAKHAIDLEIGELYDASGWTASPPPLIQQIALLLASAEAILVHAGRDSVTRPDSLVNGLTRRGMAMLRRIRMGLAPLKDAAGQVIAPRAPRHPRVAQPTDPPFGG